MSMERTAERTCSNLRTCIFCSDQMPPLCTARSFTLCACYLLWERCRRCPRCRGVRAGWSFQRLSGQCTPRHTPVLVVGVLYSTVPGNTATKGKQSNQCNWKRNQTHQGEDGVDTLSSAFGIATASAIPQTKYCRSCIASFQLCRRILMDITAVFI